MNTERGLAPFEPYEIIYITIQYKCGCAATTPVYRHVHPEDDPYIFATDDPRVFTSIEKCKLCSQNICYNPNRRVEGFKQR